MDFFDFLNSGFGTCSFKEVDNEHYILEIKVDENAVVNDVKTYVDDKRRLIIQYYYKEGNKESSAIYKETIPEDADENQIRAKLVNGKLQISARKKESME